MFEQDYLVRMLLQFFQAMSRAHELKRDNDNPLDAADLLETAIGNATDMDGAALLSLAPESIAQVMRVTGVDPNVMQFVARGMLLESVYLAEGGQRALAAVRAAQARAIADEFGFGLPEDPSDFESITEGLEEAALEGGFDNAYVYEESIGYDPDSQPASLDGIIASAIESAENDEPYWMQYGSVLEEEEKPRGGFGSFIDDEDI